MTKDIGFGEHLYNVQRRALLVVLEQAYPPNNKALILEIK